MSPFKKFFLYLGFFGIILLIPSVLYALDITSPLEFIKEYLGDFGDISILTFISFALIGMMIFFLGGVNVSASVLGLIIGFLLICTAVDISWMVWFKSATANISILSDKPLNYLIGVSLPLVGLIASQFKINLALEILILLIFPISLLYAEQERNFLHLDNKFELSINQGFKKLSSLVDARYIDNPNVKKYYEEVTTNDTLSDNEKNEKLLSLQEKIRKLEEDSKRLKQLKEENKKYEELLKEQSKHIKGIDWCDNSKASSDKITAFSDAVEPDKPCVRDFAVNLAKKEAGSFSNSHLIPNEKGLRQIASIHLHLSSKWKYVSDPTLVRNDYYSKASHSLAIGLAGDCDDFAIVNASCIEAIGGMSRIMAGYCNEGGHAWAEVFIGKENHWNEAVKVLQEFYKNDHLQLVPNKSLVDGKEYYWLPLDWRIGQYTCNEHLSKEKELYTSKDRL